MFSIFRELLLHFYRKRFSLSCERRLLAPPQPDQPELARARLLITYSHRPKPGGPGPYTAREVVGLAWPMYISNPRPVFDLSPSKYLQQIEQLRRGPLECPDAGCLDPFAYGGKHRVRTRRIGSYF